MQVSPEQECKIESRSAGYAEQECNIQEQECNPCVAHNRPVVDRPLQPPPPTATKEPGGGWRSLQEKHMASIGLWGSKRPEFIALIEQYGEDTVDKAMAAASEDGWEGVKSRPGAALHRMAQKLAEIVAVNTAGVARKNKQAEIDAFVEEQTAELVSQMKSRTPAQREVTDGMPLADFLADLEDEAPELPVTPR